MTQPEFRWRHPRPNGFSLIELLLVVALLGILSSWSLIIHGRNERAAEAHALVLELGSWLAEISMAPEERNQACTVTIQPGSSLNQGTVIGSVQPVNCALSSQSVIPLGGRSSTRYTLVASHTTWTYTRRGALSLETGSGARSTTEDITIRVNAEGQPPLLCLRISGTLGLIRFGKNNDSASTAADCTDWSRL